MEEHYTETHKTWNSIAQLYEDKFMQLELYNDTYKNFCNTLSNAAASVLEIGCGPGNITRHILDINPQLKVLATDISKNMVDLAKRNNPEVEIQILDCRNLKTLQGKFDGIICGFTIPYLSKQDCSQLIADCCGLLTEDGAFYLSFVSGDYEKSGFISSSSGERTYFYYHELESIRQELEINELLVVDVIEKEYKKLDAGSELHTILIAKKSELKNINL